MAIKFYFLATGFIIGNHTLCLLLKLCISVSGISQLVNGNLIITSGDIRIFIQMGDINNEAKDARNSCWALPRHYFTKKHLFPSKEKFRFSQAGNWDEALETPQQTRLKLIKLGRETWKHYIVRTLSCPNAMYFTLYVIL